MIYITGDTHTDFTRFNRKIFPEQKSMTKDDYVIICGDFGGIWAMDESDKSEKYWMLSRIILKGFTKNAPTTTGSAGIIMTILISAKKKK